MTESETGRQEVKVKLDFFTWARKYREHVEAEARERELSSHDDRRDDHEG